MTRLKIIRSRLIAGPPALPATLALALIFVGAPTLLRLAADRLITGTSFVTYYPFVLVAAIFIGWRGALGVALVSAMLANFLFMAPRYILFANLGDTLGTACFLVASSMTVAVVDTLRRAVIDLEAGRRREATLNGELKHLNLELQHRVKNTLTVVQGLATHTFRGHSGGEETIRTFRGRLQALAEAHAVLTSGKWEGCQLPDLPVRALAPFNGSGALLIEGPACSLPERACVPLVLVLHELGTNAVKYGALSTVSGSVEVRWDLRQGEGGGRELVLDWIERGGPAVPETPARRGLGSRLIAPQPGIDSVDLEFRAEGVACRVVVGGATAPEAQPADL
jgi:two-component sensor histidine kinase